MNLDTVPMSGELAQAHTDADYALARALFQEYASQLAIDLCFQGFEAELQQLPDMYGPPGGFLLLARGGGDCTGCVGVRRWSEDSCEMKRLYVRAGARGGGTGRALVQAAIEQAGRIGYRRMLLDTLPDMRAAQALYSALGFRACEAYRHNPISGAAFMALELAPPPDPQGSRHG